MENLLIDFNKSGYESEILSLETLKICFEKVIEHYNLLGLGHFETKDFHNLLLNTEKFLFDNLMKDKQDNISGLPVSKEKMFEIMEKPTGYYSLISEIKDINEKISSKIKSQYLKLYTGCSQKKVIDFFDFDAKGAIIIKQKKIDQAKKLYELYATTEQSKTAFLLATKVCELLNKSGLFQSHNDYYTNNRQVEKIMECIKIEGKCENAAKININKIKYF